MKYSSRLSKLHSGRMKYRGTCLWLCLIWKEIHLLLFAVVFFYFSLLGEGGGLGGVGDMRVKKQAAPSTHGEFVSDSIYKIASLIYALMYEVLRTDVYLLTSAPFPKKH